MNDESRDVESSPRGGLVTKDDSLYKLIVIGSSGSMSDASERKHEILARAYLPRE